MHKDLLTVTQEYEAKLKNFLIGIACSVYMVRNTKTVESFATIPNGCSYNNAHAGMSYVYTWAE